MMRIDLSKKILLLTILSYSTLSLGGMIPENADTKNKGIWRAEGELLYLNQSNNALQISSASTITANATTTDAVNSSTSNFTPVNSDPDYQWAWGAGLAYIFASHQYDIQASYRQLNAHKHVGNSTVASATAQNSQNAQNTLAAAQVDPDYEYGYNEGEMTFGAYKKYNNRFMVRWGYGLTYINLEQSTVGNIASTANNSVIGTSSATDFGFENEFQGGGPKLTLEGQYDLLADARSSLGLVAGLGYSLLIGGSEVKFTETTAGVTTVTRDDDTNVATGFDGTLGLRFAQMFGQHANLFIEMGYELTFIDGALQGGEFTGFPTLEVEEDGSIQKVTTLGSATVHTSFEEDYYNYGPYLRVGFDFM